MIDNNQIMSKVTSIFQEVFDDDEMSISPEMTASDVDGWDSLTHIKLIISHESAFNIKFDTTEISELKNVSDFIDLLKQKIR